MNDPITTSLLREAERATLRMDDDLAAVLREAADEIEYLRQRCEQIDQEWRQTLEGRNGK
mgnify:FL=1|jgi:predicted secreted protein